MSFLALPNDVRLMIYRLLSVNLAVTPRRAEQLPKGPWHIMRTCQLCHPECLPICYAFAM